MEGLATMEADNLPLSAISDRHCFIEAEWKNLERNFDALIELSPFNENVKNSMGLRRQSDLLICDLVHSVHSS